MNAITPLIKPGIYHKPAADYHSGPGVSKSNLDMIHVSPALLEWSRRAPIDEDAKAAVNIGTAFHSMLLEPEQFASDYVAELKPDANALVTVDQIKSYMDKAGIAYTKSASKGALTATLLDADPDAPVADALYAEWERGIAGRVVLSLAEARKLDLMRDSVMAHPVARKLIEAQGHIEECHYWHDPETGELCRSRMDKRIPNLSVILDVKTTGDMARFANSIVDYRYHVQDAFYGDGHTLTVGERNRSFVFLAVSTTRDRCRYEARLFALGSDDVELGRKEYRKDLEVYAKCRQTGIWPGIEPISLPGWYHAKNGG